MLSCLNAQCVFMSVSNAKSGGPLIQSTSLMQIMLVPWVQYVCKFSYLRHIISIWVHNCSFICNIHMLIQPFCIHKNLKMLTHPYAVWECFRADLVPSVCICIHEQPLATTCIHLQPSNITCLKHMFTPISFYLKFKYSIDRIQSNDGSEYR